MYRQYVKRALDIIISLLALIGLSPFLFVIAIVNSTIVRGNPFFLQERIGVRMMPFRIIKFKTMRIAKKSIHKELWSHGNVEITPFGEVLRRLSIDELPTLLNVILGHMSLVGPRPLLKSHVASYREKDFARHNVRPGLTGLAQINGRNSITWECRYNFDLYYVNSYNFYFDAIILMKTIFVVIAQKGFQLYGDKKELN
jgi:undecaprenyl phosphate N,N'-diacetylbacillosamine 1-phosphate transferase